ncbi:ATP-binding cassette domain-containing protein [Intestinirhabdus alba]|jgi:putative thiamine transport system ATP-binding protein|uniref:ATP-binding cassette domain-containing protein n=1 Tax=Intestinirhabdus alba TaxID=2899544 RepID=A0A6L6IJW5_9ENTR|nr:ATP-binding cassette domain-containing protein [Intestinirhabdus alba]MTH46859.1 ATP-binding cassette domain-containing protein [Intestinirhabdus alba]
MLSVHHLSLRLGATALLTQINFQVGEGEILTLMGPSGCGKSSLLGWMVGALAAPLYADGELWLNDRRVDLLPTAARRIGILFQDALLFDHFSVGQNLLLALPAALRGVARQRAVETALAQAGLEGYASRDPATLSGGQRARVALLRALLAQPRALLLDEPFSKLDAALRESFRQWVFNETRGRGIPVVQVTHDVRDAPPGGRVLQMAEYADKLR